MSRASNRAKAYRNRKNKAAISRKQLKENTQDVKEEAVTPEIIKIGTESKLKRFLKSTFFKISVVVTLISIPSYLFWFKDKIHQWTTPENELYEEENFIKGVFVPEATINPSGSLYINYGGTVTGYPISRIKEGISYTPQAIVFDNQPVFNLRFVMKNNRFYVSMIFKDIQKEEVVGELEYDHWSLFKPNLLKYKENEQALEVMDRGHNIILSMVYKHPSTIEIEGYFIGNDNITVVNSRGVLDFPKTDRQGAIEEIQKIKSTLIDR